MKYGSKSSKSLRVSSSSKICQPLPFDTSTLDARVLIAFAGKNQVKGKSGRDNESSVSTLATTGEKSPAFDEMFLNRGRKVEVTVW